MTEHDEKDLMDEGVRVCARVGVVLLREQLNWLLSQPSCAEAEGLISLCEHLLDEAEGFAGKE